MTSARPAPDSASQSPHEAISTGARYVLPALPGHHVERARPLELLDAAMTVPLTLVSAPAGTGKSTLVAAWARRRGAARTAWVTLEPDDLAPGRFWQVVHGALRHHGLASAPRTARDETPRPRRQTAPVDVVHSTLRDLADPLVLVLDGCDLTSNRTATMLDHVLQDASPDLHVVLLSRRDPVLPLHRYRLVESVAEVRMADLALSPQETAQLLETFDVRLAPQSLDVLADRTRGWVAGIRFAAMMLARSADPEEAVQQLTGDRGAIAEYLMVEVLAAQPKAVRAVLMRTSVADLLRPGLVEELAGPTAPHVVAELARADLLVQTVGAHGHRYHPLLRDLLRAELAYRSPVEHAALHVKAARWCSDQGLLEESVVLATRVGAWSQAARHVIDSMNVGRLLTAGGDDPVVATMRHIPRHTSGLHAVVVRAALDLADGDLEGCREELRRYESGVAAGIRPGRVTALSVSIVVAVLAGRADDPAAHHVLEAAMRALREHGGSAWTEHPELVAILWRGTADSLLHRGELARAEHALEVAIERAGGPLLAGCLGDLALVAALTGRLARARDLAGEASSSLRSPGYGDQLSATVVDPWLTVTWVDLEQGDIATAEDRLGDPRNGPDSSRGGVVAHVVGTVLRSRLLRGRGRAAAAQEHVLRASIRTPSLPAWLSGLMAAEEILNSVALGHPDPTTQAFSGGIGPPNGAARAAYARACIERGDWTLAAEILADGAGARDSTPASRVEEAVLEAALDAGRDRMGRARTVLLRALTEARSEQMRRPFLEAPHQVRELLGSEPELRSQAAWLRGHGAAIAVPMQRGASRRGRPAGAPGTDPDPTRLVDDLTAKELEVLGHLAELLSTEEIAATMFISVNTIRTHVRSILRKLAVTRRNEAVRRARALGLVTS